MLWTWATELTNHGACPTLWICCEIINLLMIPASFRVVSESILIHEFNLSKVTYSKWQSKKLNQHRSGSKWGFFHETTLWHELWWMFFLMIWSCDVRTRKDLTSLHMRKGIYLIKMFEVVAFLANTEKKHIFSKNSQNLIFCKNFSLHMHLIISRIWIHTPLINGIELLQSVPSYY